MRVRLAGDPSRFAARLALAGLVTTGAIGAACDTRAPAAASHLRPGTGLLAVSGACLADVAAASIEPDEPEPTDDHGEGTAVGDAGAEDPCLANAVSVARAEDALLSVASARAPSTTPAPRKLPPWDRQALPLRLDDVVRRFAISNEEIAALRRNGFFVASRLAFPSYASAFHEIYQSELPLFVSVDAVLHAVFRSTDQLRLGVEAKRIEPALGRALGILHCALPVARRDMPEAAAIDLDVYVTVARSLLAGHAVGSVYPDSGPEVTRVLAAITPAAGDGGSPSATREIRVDVFGRSRTFDAAELATEGHAGSDPRLAAVTRATAWLSRVGIDLSSQRELTLAIALADLVERSGAAPGLRAIEAALDTFDGPRDDRSPAEVRAASDRVGRTRLDEPGALERVRTDLAATKPSTVTSLLGARGSRHLALTSTLVAPSVPERTRAGSLDLAYALGLDRARAHLGGDLGRFPTLGPALDVARANAAAHVAETKGMARAWWTATRFLAETPSGVLPGFMSTDAFRDLRVDSAIVAVAQSLSPSTPASGAAYDRGGCEIPDAYVEPAPRVYTTLADGCEAASAAALAFDPTDATGARRTFAKMARTLWTLAAIATNELTGRELTEEELRWLSMIVQMSAATTNAPATYDGWYFDLFASATEALAGAELKAMLPGARDSAERTAVGAQAPRLGVFVVDTGGAPRVVVGPIAHGVEARVDAHEAGALVEPWATSYALPEGRIPPLSLTLDGDTAVVTSTEKLGFLTLELLDHHRRPLETASRAAEPGETRFTFRALADDRADVPDARRPEMLHVHLPGFDRWLELVNGAAVLDTTTKAD